MKPRIELYVKTLPAAIVSCLLNCILLAVPAFYIVPTISAESQQWFSPSDNWVTVPSGIQISGGEGNVAMLTPHSDWKKVTEDQVRLISGNMIVRARTKAVFVSQRFGSDQLMTRIAPGAIALISGPEKYTVSNLGKRCCGAVIIYLPYSKKGSTNTNKINVLAGETVSLEMVEDEKPIEHALGSELLCTAYGTIRMTRQKEDLDHAIERFNLEEILNR